MMTTLIIHPKDITTDFLKEGYEKTNFNVMNSNCSKSSVKRLINDHDKIIMMGHGGDIGLYGFKRMVIDSTYIYLLRSKIDNIYIWCNADQFVRKYTLSGFATGMIISEWHEAYDYAVAATLDDIGESNKLFAECIAKTIELPAKEMYEEMKKLYVLEKNPVVAFNRQNLFYFEPV